MDLKSRLSLVVAVDLLVAVLAGIALAVLHQRMVRAGAFYPTVFFEEFSVLGFALAALVGTGLGVFEALALDRWSSRVGVVVALAPIGVLAVLNLLLFLQATPQAVAQQGYFNYTRSSWGLAQLILIGVLATVMVLVRSRRRAHIGPHT